MVVDKGRKATRGGSGAAVKHGLMPMRAASPNAAKSLEIVRYIAEMSAQMAQMAAAADLDLLAYFLDMARIESELALRRGPHAAAAYWPPDD